MAAVLLVAPGSRNASNLQANLRSADRRESVVSHGLRLTKNVPGSGRWAWFRRFPRRHISDTSGVHSVSFK